MSARNRMVQGFTLIEILIVVVILGILAAIVIPQFSTASESAKASNLTSQLQTIRSQLELYQVQHSGSYPTAAQMWANLLDKTNSDGTTTGSPALGPYLQKAPVNPFTNTSAVGTTSSASIGWHYTAATGVIKAAVDNTTAIETGLVPSGHTAGASHADLVTY